METVNSHNKILFWILLVYAAFWTVMAVTPESRFDWLLENLLIFLCVSMLFFTRGMLPLSNTAYLLIALFLALHTYGAHYSYGSVPFNAWLQNLLGTDRNPYDRVVHLAYGVLMVYPIREAWMRLSGLKGLGASAIALAIILATGAFYELIEMWVAQIVAPDLGTLFVGAQGDPWDTHHDMELELYGAAAFLAVERWLRRNPFSSSGTVF